MKVIDNPPSLFVKWSIKKKHMDKNLGWLDKEISKEKAIYIWLSALSAERNRQVKVLRKSFLNKGFLKD